MLAPKCYWATKSLDGIPLNGGGGGCSIPVAGTNLEVARLPTAYRLWAYDLVSAALGVGPVACVAHRVSGCEATML